MIQKIVTIVLPILLPILAIALICVIVTLIGKAMYKKAPPNVAMVVTGPFGNKTIIGKGCFVIPILERVDFLSLENMQSDFTSKDDIPTKDAINILVDAVANFAVSTDPEVLPRAAAKFLGKKPEQIEAIVRPVLEGNIREIISQTTLKELIQGDKKIIAQKIIENVEPNLQDMGLELTTFNIQNFKDKKGVIDNLGLQNTVQISKDAQISKAKAEQEIAIAEANAKKAANEAQIAAQTEIAERENKLAIRKAELQKLEDIKQAEANAAYAIQEQEQRKTIEITTADANLAKQEKEIVLQERAVSIRERKLEAEIKKTAEAEKYAVQQKSDAELYATQKSSEADLFERQKKAEAEKYETEQRAAAQKAKAEAEKFAKLQEAEAVKETGLAEAAAIKAKGEAEAAAIQAKATAEAEGLLKKAEAMEKYGEAAREQQKLDALKIYFEQLPAIAEAIGAGYSNVEKMVMFGDDSSKLSGNIINNITQVSEGLNESLGIDLKSLMSAFIGGKIVDTNHTEVTE